MFVVSLSISFKGLFPSPNRLLKTPFILVAHTNNVLKEQMKSSVFVPCHTTLTEIPLAQNYKFIFSSRYFLSQNLSVCSWCLTNYTLIPHQNLFRNILSMMFSFLIMAWFVWNLQEKCWKFLLAVSYEKNAENYLNQIQAFFYWRMFISGTYYPLCINQHFPVL